MFLISSTLDETKLGQSSLMGKYISWSLYICEILYIKLIYFGKFDIFVDMAYFGSSVKIVPDTFWPTTLPQSYFGGIFWI